MSFHLPRKRRLIRGILIVSLLYGLVCAGMAINQRAFIYLPFAGVTDPKEAGLPDYSRREITGADGTPIVYWENAPHPQQPTVLYFHGNGGGLYMFVPPLAYLNAHGFHVVAMEYRGYPSAPPRPTQEALVADGIALFDHLKNTNHGTAPVIWGYSLGSGVATQVAAQRPPAALILEAPFTAVADRARELFPLLPVRFILHDQYRSRDVMGAIHAPLLVMHGTADTVIPLHHGEDLFRAANAPKTLKIYQGGGHLNLRNYGAFDDAAAFIRAQEKR